MQVTQKFVLTRTFGIFSFFSVLGIAALAAVSACDGGGDDGPPPDPAAFVGAWSYTSGTLTVKCPTGNQTQSLANQFTFAISPGTTTPLVRQQAECGSEGIPLSFEGGKAVAKNATCILSLTFMGMPLMATAKFSSWKMKTTDGKTATTEGAGDATGKVSGIPLSCQFTESGVLARQ